MGDSGFSHGDIKLAPVYDQETDSVAFSSMDGWMYVLNRKDGTLRFRVHSDYAHTSYRAGIYGQPIFTKSNVLFGSLDKSIYCIDKFSGKLVWRRMTSGRIFASPVVIDGRVFIGSNDGRLYELSLEKGKILFTTQFVERITNPVVYDTVTNSLYLITLVNELYKIDLT